MNCEEARRHWNLYYDSEGDGELYLQINEHLEDCPACAEWFQKESLLEDLITDKLRALKPDPELWDAVAARVGLDEPKAARRWLSFWGVGALAAGVLVAVLLLQLVNSNNPDLARLTAAHHRELSTRAAPVEFASSSDSEVENYLRERVGFPVRCPPRKDTGFIVEGAGVSRLAGEQTAYVYGRVDGKPVSVFILARESLERFPRQFDAVRRDGVHHCREGDHEMVMAQIDRNVVLVLGRADARRLERVLNAYATYPHGRLERRGSRASRFATPGREDPTYAAGHAPRATDNGFYAREART